MDNQNQDERYSVVESAIFDTFLLLLMEKDIKKITVTDIIKKAGIVRSTFYNHYDNIPDLAAAMEEKTLDELFSIMTNFSLTDNNEICKQYFIAICNYTKDNPFISNLISNTKHSDDFFTKSLQMLHRFVTDVSTSKDNNSYDTEYSYVVAAAIGSTIGVLHKWAREQFKVPVESIAELLTRTYISGIIQFMR